MDPEETGAVVPAWRPIFASLKLCGLMLCGLAVAAGAEPMPAVPAQDLAAFGAIGRLNVAGHRTRGMCSATLVAPDRVVTAAHCLWRGDGQAHRLADMTFVAGWHRGAANGDAGIVAAALHPRAVQAGAIVPTFDIAVLTLARPLTQIAPLAVQGDGLTEGPYALLGYQRSRPHWLGGRFGCDIGLRALNLITTACAVEAGASGGPALLRGPQGWAVVGVISAGSPDRTLVARTRGWAAEVLAGP